MLFDVPFHDVADVVLSRGVIGVEPRADDENDRRVLGNLGRHPHGHRPVVQHPHRRAAVLDHHPNVGEASPVDLVRHPRFAAHCDEMPASLRGIPVSAEEHANHPRLLAAPASAQQAPREGRFFHLTPRHSL